MSMQAQRGMGVGTDPSVPGTNDGNPPYEKVRWLGGLILCTAIIGAFFVGRYLVPATAAKSEQPIASAKTTGGDATVADPKKPVIEAEVADDGTIWHYLYKEMPLPVDPTARENGKPLIKGVTLVGKDRVAYYELSSYRPPFVPSSEGEDPGPSITANEPEEKAEPEEPRSLPPLNPKPGPASKATSETTPKGTLPNKSNEKPAPKRTSSVTTSRAIQPAGGWVPAGYTE